MIFGEAIQTNNMNNVWMTSHKAIEKDSGRVLNGSV